MENQQVTSPRDQVNRDQHKSLDLSTKTHWVYSQGPLKLLKVTQRARHVTISLLRFNVGVEKQSTVYVWRLPFKLSVIKSYLMKNTLSHDESKDIHLNKMLLSDMLEHEKFSELLMFRILEVTKSLAFELGDLAPQTSTVDPGSSFDPTIFLRSSNFRDSNIFIKEIKNNMQCSVR